MPDMQTRRSDLQARQQKLKIKKFFISEVIFYGKKK